eukprot:TRINITY_DN9144_c0_g1_i1.p1 TRINITY_DN9144_c0_g1~~TRINITY_DN9144_c0_g1_i1.p1  ORF type:complete len:225 (-),score=55.82 TRINITY_DN9144_c0_g1_i1:305-955(-)
MGVQSCQQSRWESQGWRPWRCGARGAWRATRESRSLTCPPAGGMVLPSVPSLHRYRPDLIEWDKLDEEDWTGNCSLAFKIAEDKLDIPALLDVEDVVNHDSPDKFSIMTYVAQFYHKFEDSYTDHDSGLSSMATTATSSEESTPKRLKSDNKKGAIHSLMQIKKTRPVSWHGRGRVELTIQNKPVENDNPFTKEDLKYHDEILKAFNKNMKFLKLP